MGFKSNMIRALSKAKYVGAKHAPGIFFVAGLVLDGIALYSIIKKSGKIKNIIKEHNDKIDELHDIPVQNTPEAVDEKGEPVSEIMFESEKAKNSEIRHQYLVTTGRVAKAVAVPASLWLGAKLCYFSSNNILNARYLGAAGLYKAAEAKFNQYRQRNIELHGEEADADCMYGGTVDVMEVAPENEGGVVTKTTTRFKENAIDDLCTVWFDEESDLFTRDHNMNEFNVRQQEEWANRRCKAYGFIDLYDILKGLGKADLLTGEQIFLAKNLGRVWDENKTDEQNWISFGIDDHVNADKRNPVLTLNIDCKDLLENVLPMHKQLGVYNNPIPFR